MNRTVLVVDNDSTYRSAFCNLLQFCFPEIRILQAEDGTHALSMTRLIAFDLIILDYYLQALSGSDVVRYLRQRADGRHIPPIVVMSASPDVEIFARTMRIAAFLNKPSMSEDLLAVVGPLLEAPVAEYGAALGARRRNLQR